MFTVYFFENKNLLLSQLLNRVPTVGDHLTIKGRKGKVSSVSSSDEKSYHVQVLLEKVTKNKTPIDNSKKKKR
ncbi:hypothetical protein [Cytobacillus massiliigabonensis]|uniref:hypothetical protein n=1 Tax=Cytobacillus massiliigabonensis TaxID=1871011 RepID=UPI000C861C7A|nr:hypothetical protein [Cytobacillus massiliigabonensis]